MTSYLVDSSAWFISARSSEARARLADLAPRLLISTAPPIMFELLTAARDGREFRHRRRQIEALDVLDVEPGDWTRALDTYQALAEQAPLHHRRVGRADLLVAAVAERFGRPILHYDQDFEVIAALTNQPVEWIVPRGSV